jgi:hypothetical protein
MPPALAELPRRLAALRAKLEAPAAGVWQVRGQHLEALAFDAAPDMAIEVASGFTAATALVPLDRRELGVIASVLERRVVVSVAAELPEDIGSGFWLRAFGASRSVAVPIVDPNGTVKGVVSVALAAGGRSDDEVAALIRAEAADWLSERRDDAL